MKWENVRRLDFEISSLCNAACPQCGRHPTSSNLINPILSEKKQWTMDQVEKYLPKSDLTNISSYLFNGNYGDFITNINALEIINYFYEASSDASFHINTNGSARTENWWRELARIPKLKITFAIDGLEDTHALYRRNTDFHTILRNAQAFIDEGGDAEWAMTIFEHNEHQLSLCREMAINLGFSNFYPRYSYRGTSLVSNDGIPLYYVSQAKSLNMYNSQRTPYSISKIVQMENDIVSGAYQAKQNHTCLPLANKSDCMSYSEKSIFVGADWFVAPCCYIGNLGYNYKNHWGYDDFTSKLSNHGFSYDDLFVSDDKTVKDVVNFSWILDNVTTKNVLSVCTKNCQKRVSPVQISRSQQIQFA